MLICYYSRTGNTEKMARALGEGASEVTEVTLVAADQAEVSHFKGEALILLGCPALGSEEVDHEYLLPLLHQLGGEISEKEFFLFGSYDWGSGTFMRIWKSDLEFRGAKVLGTHITRTEPSTDELEELREKGRLLAEGKLPRE
ncbi:MAG: flavodoxin domain-containing protein [Tissierellia bacterium]|nr:flavodoxin domain-containing protein [Tissierellia bacterium]